jgi:hypothetical protein
MIPTKVGRFFSLYLTGFWNRVVKFTVPVEIAFLIYAVL